MSHRPAIFLDPPAQPTLEEVIAERDALAAENLQLIRELRDLRGSTIDRAPAIPARPDLSRRGVARGHS